MTPNEAIKFAKSLPESTTHPDRTAPGEIEVLRAIAREASPAAVSRVQRQMLERAEAFRRADAPGHQVWYASHLRAAAFACSYNR